MYLMSKIVLHVPVFLTPSAIIPNTVHSRKGHALLHPPLPKSLLALVEEADKMVYYCLVSDGMASWLSRVVCHNYHEMIVIVWSGHRQFLTFPLYSLALYTTCFVCIDVLHEICQVMMISRKQ